MPEPIVSLCGQQRGPGSRLLCERALAKGLVLAAGVPRPLGRTGFDDRSQANKAAGHWYSLAEILWSAVG